MFFILSLSLVSGLSSSDCPVIACGPGITSDTCISVEGTSVTLTACKAGYLCDYTSFLSHSNLTNTSCTYVGNPLVPCTGTYSNQATGLACCQNTDCASQNCPNYICVGTSAGTACATTASCNAGLYCNEGICTALHKVGDSCKIDDECAIGTGCNVNICVGIFSLAKGSATSKAMFCQSNFMFNGLCDTVSVKVNNVAIPSPFQCTIGGPNCVYLATSSSKQISSLPCLCGGNSTSIGYCGGYLEYTDTMAQMNTELVYSTSTCSGNLAHSVKATDLYNCNSIGYEVYYKYMRYYGQLAYNPLYQSGVVNYCSMSLTLFDANYVFTPQVGGISMISVGSLLAVIILL